MTANKARFRSRIAPAAVVAMALGPLAALSAGSQVRAAHAEGTRSAALESPTLNEAGLSAKGRSTPRATPERRITGPQGVVSVEFFGSLLRATGFGGLLRVDRPYTLFVPVDAAFEHLAGEQLSNLTHDPQALRALVASHVTPGRISSADLRAGEPLVSGGGTTIAASPEGPLLVNGTPVIASEETAYGVVHIVGGLI
jgi:uncharacterized surface protein with fasciclin (FAS1) repeats